MRPGVFFQGAARLHDGFRGILTYITIMPRFIRHARDIFFSPGVAQDEAVVRAVGVQPFKFRRVFKIRRQVAVLRIPVRRNDICGKARVMLRGAGARTHMAACFSASSRLKPSAMKEFVLRLNSAVCRSKLR